MAVKLARWIRKEKKKKKLRSFFISYAEKSKQIKMHLFFPL